MLVYYPNSKTNFNFRLIPVSSAKYLKLDQSKILSCVKEFTLKQACVVMALLEKPSGNIVGKKKETHSISVLSLFFFFYTVSYSFRDNSIIIYHLAAISADL